MKTPADEINQGADEAIKRFPFIDGSRQAAAGASYGGHLANWMEATVTASAARAQRLPLPVTQETIIRGDSLSISVACASIVAKVSRDRIMEIYHHQFPQYNFIANKGYGTRDHLEAIRCHGSCKIHRRSFKGVKGTLDQGEKE